MFHYKDNMSILTAQFIKLNKLAKEPTRAHSTDSGLDLTTVAVEKCDNGQYKISTGLGVLPPVGYSFDLISRSSTGKDGWSMANGFGVIDASYKNEIIAYMVPNVKSPEELIVGAMHLQLVMRHLLLPGVAMVKELDGEDRKGGFGSTTKKSKDKKKKTEESDTEEEKPKDKKPKKTSKKTSEEESDTEDKPKDKKPKKKADESDTEEDKPKDKKKKSKKADEESDTEEDKPKNKKPKKTSKKVDEDSETEDKPKKKKDSKK